MHMSRIGKKAIIISVGVIVSFKDGVLSVKGKSGEISKTIRPVVGVTVTPTDVTFAPVAETRLARALWGTYTAHFRNMVEGVTNGFKKDLIIEGVGYRATLQGQKVVLSLGFSHPVNVDIPKGITVTVDKGSMSIAGIDKDAVGQFAANIRALKKPEPYKGKGIRYSNEVIRRKQGKKAAA
jgi:large subunit ribosomal protein L6